MLGAVEKFEGWGEENFFHIDLIFGNEKTIMDHSGASLCLAEHSHAALSCAHSSRFRMHATVFELERLITRRKPFVNSDHGAIFSTTIVIFLIEGAKG